MRGVGGGGGGGEQMGGGGGKVGLGQGCEKTSGCNNPPFTCSQLGRQ